MRRRSEAFHLRPPPPFVPSSPPPAKAGWFFPIPPATVRPTGRSTTTGFALFPGTMADGGFEVITAVVGTVGLETGGVTTMGYCGPKNGVWVLVLVHEGVGSTQQPWSIVQPVTVLVPQKEGMRDKNSLVHCERPHLLQGDVPNAPSPGYSLSSVRWHPAIRCFSAGLGDLTGHPEDLPYRRSRPLQNMFFSLYCSVVRLWPLCGMSVYRGAVVVDIVLVGKTGYHEVKFALNN